LHRIFFTTLSALLLTIAASAQAEELTDSKRADIRKLFNVLGVTRMPDQFADLTVQSLRLSLRSCLNCTAQTFSVVEHEALALFREKMDQESGLMERMLKVYHKHFSQAEIRQLLVFYETPIGKKVARETPLIGKEGLIEGQQWSQSLGPELQIRIKTALEKVKLPMPTIPSNAETK